MRVLILESSTTSAKAMLYSTSAGVLEVRTQPYSTLAYDGITHDANAVLAQTAALGRSLSAGHPIDMVALGGAWHSVLLCDHHMDPQSRVYPWTYNGAKAVAHRVRQDSGMTRSIYGSTGCMPNATYPAMKLLHLKEDGYALGDKYICGQGSYNFYRLTGVRAVTACMGSGSGLINIHQKQFDAELLRLIGIGTHQLGEIIPFDRLYPLSAEGAALLCLPTGTPVVSALPDGALNQIGADALGEGIMTFSVGTSAAMRFSAPSPVLPAQPSVWCYLTPTTWLSGAATAGACNCVDWIRASLFTADTPYQDMESDGIGQDNPIFLPFLFGERCPNWQDTRNASFCDVLPQHNKRDFYRSVLEGVLFNLYQCFEILRALNGEPKAIKLSGGILNSALWTQMCCDIFGRPMERSTLQQASLLGAASVSHYLLGQSSQISALSLEKNSVLIPNPERHKAYQARYLRYLDWYQRSS